MVEIIKYGHKRNKCKECGCLYTYEKTDIKAEQIGMNEYMHYVKCPDCGCKNEL